MTIDNRGRIVSNYHSRSPYSPGVLEYSPTHSQVTCQFEPFVIILKPTFQILFVEAALKNTLRNNPIRSTCIIRATSHHRVHFFCKHQSQHSSIPQAFANRQRLEFYCINGAIVHQPQNAEVELMSTTTRATSTHRVLYSRTLIPTGNH